MMKRANAFNRLLCHASTDGPLLRLSAQRSRQTASFDLTRASSPVRYALILRVGSIRVLRVPYDTLGEAACPRLERRGSSIATAS